MTDSSRDSAAMDVELTTGTDRASILMQEMTFEDYLARVRGEAVIIVPCGAIEQHGPHLPMKADAFIATAIAERIARVHDALVAPSFNYGCKSQALSGGGQVFGGTTSLDSDTFTRVLRDVLRELMRHGATRLLVLNGHGENQFPIYEGVDLALRDTARDNVKIVVTGWWQFVSEDRIREIFPGEFPGWDLEHAATTETSLMLALDPDSVRHARVLDERMEHVPPYAVFPQPRNLVPRSGVMSRATPASLQLGEALLETVMLGFDDLFEREFS